MDVLQDFFRKFLLPDGPFPSLPFMNLKGPTSDTADEIADRSNALMIQFFTWESKHAELSWWTHFEQETTRLSELGVTQVWLPPPNKATRRAGQGYDAYDLWDLGEFDQKGAVPTRWGTKEELVQGVQSARSKGIAVVIDAVLNHKMGADGTEKCLAIPVDPKNRLRSIGREREIEAWTKYDFGGRSGNRSSLQWSEAHFTGVDWDHKTRKKEIYRFSGPGHLGWSSRVDPELGNYDYLLGADIDHRHPDVRSDLLNWGKWVLEATGGSGFRLDAIKHMDRQFIRDFLVQVRQQPDHAKLFAVAEYWSPYVRRIEDFIRKFSGTLSFFDVPLHYNFHQASKLGPKYDLRRILDNSLVKRRPGDAVTFVDNHDTQIGQTLESWVYKEFKLQAYALILLRGVGHPCVFYGDLYPNDECYDTETAVVLEKIIQARKTYAYGPLTDYFTYRNCIGFVRAGLDDRPGCVVLLSNGSSPPAQPTGRDTKGKVSKDKVRKEERHSIQMHLGKKAVGRTYTPYLAGQASSETVKVGEEGHATFTCPASGVEIWISDDNSI